MKTIHFTSEEKTLIIPYIQERLHFYQAEAFPTKQKYFYISPLESTVEKLAKDIDCSYSPNEKLSCVSCINEHIDELYKQVNTKLTPFEWLAVSDIDRHHLQLLDTANSILKKCGYVERIPFTKESYYPVQYSSVFETISKLRECGTVYLSKTGENDYYKIMFVHSDAEGLMFELKKPLSMTDSQTRFFQYYGRSIHEYGKSSFTESKTREQAKQVLSNLNASNYPIGMLNFVCGVLN